ncbi:cilia- and flagella-associated protein 299-like [Tribolium madens]|uniref:cilia- and flagella-associated protein 299-like n=1 Tax=Tribolium madens TaxID=41895 RepID=UPI001CF75F05|nr:cilia- and flagella-associated protein 299-like [Tribolium madens]
MAHITATSTPQIEADRRLLQFETYEDYLDSLITEQDRCYLQDTVAARTIAELGYRSSGETLSRQQFEKRLAAVIAYLYPDYKPYELASEGIAGGDPIQKELAIRERPNRVGILSTIIFLRYQTKKGFEVSGYIDYAHRLSNQDWKPFFREGQQVLPQPTDLGYYHWKLGKTMSNNSINYKVCVDPVKGLVFQNRYDRRIICVDPSQDPGANTTRKRVESDIYDHVILYDHVVRQRI